MKLIGLICTVMSTLTLLILITGCSSTSGGNNLRITASSPSVPPSGTLHFTASRAVTWSVLEPYGGTITADGVYTAPLLTGVFHIIATDIADTTHNATYTVSVTSAPAANTFAAGPMADAAYVSYRFGANLVRWPQMSDRAVAYIVYRDTNQYAPVAVVRAPMNYYVDSATPLSPPTNILESSEVTIDLDAQNGMLTQFNYTTTYDTTLAQLQTPAMTLSPTNFTITARRVPLQAGETSGYQVQVLYIEYQKHYITDPISHPDSYALRLGNKSSVSARATLTTPPALLTPADSQVPTDGLFNCQQVQRATSYLLQVSSEPTFAASTTVAVPALPFGTVAQANLPLASLMQKFPAATVQLLYWRMGARVDGQIFPFALSTPNVDGWVFSLPNTFMMPAVPPNP